MADAELKQRKPARGAAAAQQPLDAEEEAKPLAPAAAAAAAAAAPQAAPSAPAPAAAFPHTLALVLLAACLVATYSLESQAPTLDYVGRYIMVAVQVVHLAASAAFGVRQDWLVAAALANAAAFTRFWRIEDPQSIIFDEAHFNKFTTWYISQHYYVDIHPPLAKLVFAAVLYALGFKGAQEEKIEWWVEASRGGFIGTKDWLLLYEADWGSPYIPLRRTSAAAGTAFVVIVFLTCRAIGLRAPAAAFGAWLAMGELVILVQSRAILCDIFLYTFNVATMGASFASARPGLSEPARLAWCAVTGLMLGCALSVKLTALGTLATVGIHQGLSILTDDSLPALFPAPAAAAAAPQALEAPPEAQAAAGSNPKLSKKAAPAPASPAAAPAAPAKPSAPPPAPELSAPALLAFSLTGLLRAAAILLPTAAIFFGLWTLHLDILKYSGQGDNFMRDEFKGMLMSKPPAHPKPGQLDTRACPNIVNTWSDCGYAGISEQQCLDKGCCWDPTSSRAWCYHLGELKRPQMAWWPKILETLRATWANNNGGAVMEHPFMSQWWEWPTMDASTVPFAATHEGGQLKALGNPAVWWGVTANFLAVTPLWALVALRLRDWGGVRARFPRSAAALDPLLIPFATLYAGYLLNLVPYQLIARSKFVYHYIPALMQGVLLFATAAEAMVRFGGVLGGAPRLASRAALLALYAVVLAAFLYWGLPYGYGYKISPRQNAARMWNKKW